MSPVMDWFQQAGTLSSAQLAWALGGAAFLENLVPPLPMDVVVAYGGYLASQARLGWWVAWWATLAGGWAGFMLVFFFGRAIARTPFHQRMLDGPLGGGLGKAEQWFRRYGFGAVAGNRFLAGARAVISLFAGLAELSPLRVGIWALVSLGLWNTLLLGAGYRLGQDWEKIAQGLEAYRNVIFMVLALMAVAWWWKNRSA